MEKTRKNLKAVSIVVMALAGLSLLNILFELFFGQLNESLNGAAIPEGAPANVVTIAKVFVLVVSVLLLLPHLYVGIKGMKIAANPDDSNAHIIWAIILIVLTACELITPFISFVKGDKAFENVAELCSIMVDIGVLYEYVKLAKAVREGN